MKELQVGGLAKFSNYYLQLLRGIHKQRCQQAVFEVVWVNDVSCGVRPRGIEQKFPTQYNRRYLQPFEEQLTEQLICRFCRRPINKDTVGAIPDVDPVTGEQSGYLHTGCQPDIEVASSSV